MFAMFPFWGKKNIYSSFVTEYQKSSISSSIALSFFVILGSTQLFSSTKRTSSQWAAPKSNVKTISIVLYYRISYLTIEIIRKLINGFWLIDWIFWVFVETLEGRLETRGAISDWLPCYIWRNQSDLSFLARKVKKIWCKRKFKTFLSLKYF